MQPQKEIGQLPKRARRRAHLQRMKAKARLLFPHDLHARLAEHLKVCSCPLCGNARRYLGLTLQEVKAELRRNDEY
jgi:hypothetical protein